MKIIRIRIIAVNTLRIRKGYTSVGALSMIKIKPKGKKISLCWGGAKL
jgi:hypothetical protein